MDTHSNCSEQCCVCDKIDNTGFTIKFEGVGSAFNKDEGQSNAILECDGKKMLIDCGSYFWRDTNLNHLDIDTLYVSHLHADHVGGIEELAFCTFFNPTAPMPRLVGNFRVTHDLWEQSLRGGLESVQARQMSLDDYFNVERLADNGTFDFYGVKCKPVQTVHVVNDCTIKMSFGLLMQKGCKGKKIFFTSDTQFCPNQISDFYNLADVIFQDCETSKFKSGVHAHYNDLRELPDDVKKKMYLYHYQGSRVDLPDADASGFAGFVERHKVYEF